MAPKKHRGSPKLPRQESQRVTALESGEITQIAVNFETGEAALICADGRKIKLEMKSFDIHKRDPATGNLKRIAAQVPVASGAGWGIAKTVAAFTHLYAVDVTPDLKIPGRHVAVVVAVSGFNTKVAEATVVKIFDFGEVQVDEERLGWYFTCEWIQSLPGYSDDWKVGLITDADLGEHDQYNSGALEALPGWKLPSNVVLCYAKADSANSNDSLLNAAVNLADREGHDYLAKNPVPKVD